MVRRRRGLGQLERESHRPPSVCTKKAVLILYFTKESFSMDIYAYLCRDGVHSISNSVSSPLELKFNVHIENNRHFSIHEMCPCKVVPGLNPCVRSSYQRSQFTVILTVNTRFTKRRGEEAAVSSSD
jgi:hypothetical protein